MSLDRSSILGMASNGLGPAIAAEFETAGFPAEAKTIFDAWLGGESGQTFYLTVASALNKTQKAMSLSPGIPGVPGLPIGPSLPGMPTGGFGQIPSLPTGGIAPTPPSTGFLQGGDLIQTLITGAAAAFGIDTTKVKAIYDVLVRDGKITNGMSAAEIAELLSIALGAANSSSGGGDAYGPDTGSQNPAPSLPAPSLPAPSPVTAFGVGAPAAARSYRATAPGNVVVTIPNTSPWYAWALQNGGVAVVPNDGSATVVAKVQMPKQMARKFGWKPAAKGLITPSEMRTINKARRLEKKVARVANRAGVTQRDLTAAKKC